MKKKKDEMKTTEKEKEEKVSVSKTTVDLLPFVGIEKNIFYMRDNTYMDIFKFTTKDLISASASELDFDMIQFERFYKMYSPDCKIVGINFPTDTKKQQQYYLHKINDTDNPLFKEILQTKYEELVDVNTYCTDREYYLMIFCTTYEKYLEAKNIILVTLGNTNLISEISLERKIDVVTKMCNKATSIYA